MSAAEQLRLDVGEQGIAKTPQVDLVDAMICAHGGDARRAVRELMADADFLRDQLATAAMLMGQGYTRGWLPKYERIG
jgi:hypothetical protein